MLLNVNKSTQKDGSNTATLEVLKIKMGNGFSEVLFSKNETKILSMVIITEISKVIETEEKREHTFFLPLHRKSILKK